ncbi:MAG: patatin-like phospholipase family protein [Tenuifilaceae bacterium]
MKKLTAILILLLIFKNINCQTVGLVLSGGGAKGLAHIGVIKALEENNIPIDYITGTSMGAIVGGLYAIGYTPDEMIAAFKSKDFYYWSSGKLNETHKHIFNERIADASILNFEVSADSSFFKPLLPSNIVPTNQMDFAFMKIFAAGNASANNNFDNLFVPFRCVASDIQNKIHILFKSGDLGDAIRASMTIPLYFKPLIIDGKMLFDGGIYNNFPWKEMKFEFNPSFIIGSKVANNTKPPKEDDIFLQLENMIVGQTDYTIPDSLGYLIETNLKDIEILDFTKIDYIVNEGYNNTIKNIEMFKKSINRTISIEEINKRRNEFKKNLPELKFRNLNISGINSKQKEYILKSIKKKSEFFSMQTAEEEYYRIITDEFVKRMYPKVKYDSTSKLSELDLLISLKKNIDISLGGNLSSSSINQGFFAASYNFFGKTANMLYANIYFGRLYSSLNLSLKKKIPFKVPLSITTSVILNRTDYYRSSNQLFFEDVKPSFLIKNDAFGHIEFTAPISKSIIVSQNNSFGTLINEYYQIADFSRSDTPDRTYFTFVNNSFKIEKKTLNKKQYAFRGRNMYLKFNYIYGKEEHVPGTTSIDLLTSYKYHSWFNLMLHNESYHRVYKDKIWIGVLFQANYSNKSVFSNYTSTILTSQSFSPSPHNRTLFINGLHSDKFFGIGIIPNIKLHKEIYLRVEGYLYTPITIISRNIDNKAYYSDNTSTYKLFGSVGLVTHTPVGPLSLSLNYYPGEIKEYYLVFNYGFILFNRKGLE